ncbi:adenosine deaminase/editase [Dipodascopsis uninucleata]
MPDLGNRIARLCFSTYESCPSKAKPRTRSNGTREWTNLAAIVIERGNRELICASLATGVKCLPDASLEKSRGRFLHDSHAEILAIRAFNRYILTECRRIQNENGYESPCIDRLNNDIKYQFCLREECRLYLLVTELPCGDSSMEALSAGKSPWNPLSTFNNLEVPLKGRSYFSEIGKVRTKPGRSDSPETRSKSCSDKLATFQLTSLLLSPTSVMVSPKQMYLTSIIIPSDKCFRNSINRAFAPCGRLSSLHSSDISSDSEYTYRPFSVLTYSADVHRFEHSKEAVIHDSHQMASFSPSNVSLIYIENESTVESIVKGIKVGAKPTSIAAASLVSRVRLFKLCFKIMSSEERIISTNYYDMKRNNISRTKAKEAIRNILGNWVPTSTDNFSLEEHGLL